MKAINQTNVAEDSSICQYKPVMNTISVCSAVDDDLQMISKWSIISYFVLENWGLTYHWSATSALRQA